MSEPKPVAEVAAVVSAPVKPLRVATVTPPTVAVVTVNPPTADPATPAGRP